MHESSSILIFLMCLFIILINFITNVALYFFQCSTMFSGGSVFIVAIALLQCMNTSKYFLDKLGYVIIYLFVITKFSSQATLYTAIFN